jgi:hypothetical protein
VDCTLSDGRAIQAFALSGDPSSVWSNTMDLVKTGRLPSLRYVRLCRDGAVQFKVSKENVTWIENHPCLIPTLASKIWAAFLIFTLIPILPFAFICMLISRKVLHTLFVPIVFRWGWFLHDLIPSALRGGRVSTLRQEESTSKL